MPQSQSTPGAPDGPTAASKVRVAYIAGYGRSGSTLLLHLLSRYPGVVAAGELFEIWTRGFIENNLCGCGQPFRECPFWSSVATKGFGGIDAVDAAYVDGLRAAVEGGLFLRYVLGRRLKPRTFVNALEQYPTICERLVGAVQAVSGAAVVVDSSKTFRHALTLGRAPGLDVRLIHLVRDSRAVVYSWSKGKVRPEVRGERKYMVEYGTFQATTEWMGSNGGTSFLGAIGWPLLRVHYGELVQSPTETLHRIAHFLEIGDPPPAAEVGESIDLPTSHTIGGNPGLFGRKHVEIRPDTRWRQDMPLPRRLFITAATLPLLVTYGYLGPRAEP